ncbi:hypothetical protein [Sediminicoccus rosea]|uniref:Uncharacterized protein n=1 Tax=Sediminicoccus rosea TaxID=1225128 RepID=A0ABZ0PR28_9PROT|nr:hypothetical protein [Sediminicoccus rosea]WPB87636.1 hypothetical protein R9Z33_12310 [Sediminicoccus rosea]
MPARAEFLRGMMEGLPHVIDERKAACHVFGLLAPRVQRAVVGEIC